MKRTLLTTLGWILANALLLAGIIDLDMQLNFFNWHPEWSGRVAGCLAGMLVVIALLPFLSRATQSRVALAIAAVACLALLGFVLAVVGPEPLGTGWLARTAPSPAWYRWGRTLVGAVPMGFWTWALIRWKARPT